MCNHQKSNLTWGFFCIAWLLSYCLHFQFHSKVLKSSLKLSHRSVLNKWLGSTKQPRQTFWGQFCMSVKLLVPCTLLAFVKPPSEIPIWITVNKQEQWAGALSGLWSLHYLIACPLASYPFIPAGKARSTLLAGLFLCGLISFSRCLHTEISSPFTSFMLKWTLFFIWYDTIIDLIPSLISPGSRP